ncbi:Nif3-like dinuclear metal center hexameric protein [Rapidithrix thailandica]|uniref:GTP cyclohydrolase 1 type 2 homolog n=1 Tax=Rapidithrix thailandica TaxID=413964 RepID=A0AAW9SA06_9BACT
MLKIKDITTYLESKAPRSYQESYDNAGLIVGNPEEEVKGVLVTLDSTEEIVEEAVRTGCNLIVAHHPIVFSGLKKLTGSNYVERTVIKAIKHDIAIYAIHTNLDNVEIGVNRKIAEQIGLENCRILAPKSGRQCKLVTFVPEENKQDVLSALSEAGAGVIGNYSKCSYQTKGTGTFEPNEQTNPHIGEQGSLEYVEEVRLEMVFPDYLQGALIAALKQAHPYEEVAYDIYPLLNNNGAIGSGMIGTLPEAQSPQQFLLYLKERMNLHCIRHTPITGHQVQRVAVCGGAGSFLLKAAKAQKADVFITGDFKYHEFFDAEGTILIADIGHYESEVFTKELLADWLKEQFKGLRVCLSDVNTNPVHYL